MARSKGVSKAALDSDQRRVLIGAAIAQAALLSLPASFNYMLPSMLSSFGASDTESTVLRQVSSLAALLVVFLAGVLGERLGGRRIMLAAALIFTLGSIVVAVAPIVQIATVGLLLANIGKSVVTVVALAFVAFKIRDSDGRAAAFATLASIVPLCYLVIPVVAGAMTSALGWRSVAVLWALLGLVAVVAVQRLIPSGGATLTSGEMWTPALAGLLLTTTVQFLSSLASEGMSTQTIAYAAASAASLVALIVAYRLITAPSLSLQPLRHGGVVFLLIVLLLFSFANLYYYNTLLYQIVYGYSALGAAVVMIPTQVGSIVGAALARKLLPRLGVAVSGSAMIFVLGVSMLAAAFIVRETSPLLLPVIIVTCYAVASVAAFVALTTAIMGLAESGEEGVTSSFKSAASNIGAALGVCVMTLVVSNVGISSMQAQMDAAGMSSSSTTAAAAWDLLYGATTQDVADQYAISEAEAEQLDAMDRIAYVEAYRAQALVGGVLSILCSVLFLATRRRYEQQKS